MAGLLNLLGSTRRRKTSKRARLNRLNKKLDKKIAEAQLMNEIAKKKKALGIY